MRVVVAAYNQEYVERISRRSRRLAQKILPQIVRATSSQWDLSTGGSYFGVGVGGGVTGNSAELGLMDDPIKGREEAESQALRDKMWDWYIDEFSTRIQKGGSKLLIYTPWQVDDIGGRILDSNESSKWTVLRMPAIAEENDPLGRQVGEALCPDRKTLEDLEDHKSLMGDYSFQAMYQCNPVHREGNLFKPDEIQIIDSLPLDQIGRPVALRELRAWDLAASAGKNDYTAGVKLGVDAQGVTYILGMHRGQWAADIVEENIQSVSRLDGSSCRIYLPQDPGQAGKSQIQHLVLKLGGSMIDFGVQSGNKETRAFPLASQVNSGNVRMIKGPWNKPLIDEMRAFPNGAHDDQVDALASAYNALMTGKTELIKKGRAI
jgi:predicted phage terminase large subunit-like protein